MKQIQSGLWAAMSLEFPVQLLGWYSCVFVALSHLFYLTSSQDALSLAFFNAIVEKNHYSCCNIIRIG